MEIEIIEKNDRKIIFVVKGISVEMINALRRIIVSEVPVFAIDEVIFLKNDSPLYDEIISHRLGLIPLKTDLEKYNLPKDCECGGFGCPLCQVSLTCEITNTANKPIFVNSGDLKSNDPNIIPVDPNIPIIKIDKNAKFIIEAYAILGTSRNHVKHQAASACFFRYLPEIQFDEKDIKDAEEKKLIARMCPERLYTLNGSLKLKEDYWKTCTMCDACEKNSNNKIKVKAQKDSYIFVIESDGVLPFDALLKKTFEIFNEKIDEFDSKLEEIKI